MTPATEKLNNHEITIRHLLDGFSSKLIDNDKHTFVPAALYQENRKSKYLDFLGLNDEDSVVCADYLSEAGIYNVYTVPKTEFEALKAENREFYHTSSVVVARLIHEGMERTDDTRVYLNINDQRFEMTVLNGGNLLFDNSFRFKTQEDFLYFLLYSLEQLHIDSGSVPIYFFGMIEEDSKLVELTKRYVRDVRFKKELKCE